MTQPVSARFLADLPAGRRNYLSWLLERSRVSPTPDLVLSTLQDKCTLYVPAEKDRLVGAAVDALGTYHLVAPRRVICLGAWRPANCFSLIRLSSEVVTDIYEIPYDRRCRDAQRIWPPTLDMPGPIGDIRRILVEAFGAKCATCDDWGRHVDHDHATGLVRGYLCGSCNACVDWCHHISGCRFSEYLAAPPAAALGIPYPATRRVR